MKNIPFFWGTFYEKKKKEHMYTYARTHIYIYTHVYIHCLFSAISTPMYIRITYV